jgi:diamine N-acetyltransferase
MAGQSLAVVALTTDNVENVLAVAPSPEQLRHVNPVAWYIARSAYQRVWHPVGLATADGEVVGFAEWAYDDSDGTYNLGGIVIDHRHQGRGLGRSALDALVAHLRAREVPGDIVLTVHAENERARRLYERYGFSATGEVMEDELVMVLGRPSSAAEVGRSA